MITVVNNVTYQVMGDGASPDFQMQLAKQAIEGIVQMVKSLDAAGKKCTLEISGIVSNLDATPTYRLYDCDDQSLSDKVLHLLTNLNIHVTVS